MPKKKTKYGKIMSFYLSNEAIDKLMWLKRRTFYSNSHLVEIAIKELYRKMLLEAAKND